MIRYWAPGKPGKRKVQSHGLPAWEGSFHSSCESLKLYAGAGISAAQVHKAEHANLWLQGRRTSIPSIPPAQQGFALSEEWPLTC